MNTKDICGAWTYKGIRFFRDGKEVGFWAEQGLWIFDESGYFSFCLDYLGDDPNYPKELTPSLQSGGTFQLSGDSLITRTISSSQKKRIGKEQNYQIEIKNNTLHIRADSPDQKFSFISECKRP